MANANLTAIDPVRAAENNAGAIFGILTPFFVLGLVFTVLRLYSRIVIIKSAGWDDWCMIICLLSTFTALIIYVFELPYGLGRHMDTLTAEQKRQRTRLAYWQAINVNVIALTSLKLSIGLCLLRLRDGFASWYKWTLWFVIGFVGIWGIFGVISLLSHCQPLAKHWDDRIEGTCYAVEIFIKIGTVVTGIGIATDVILAILPVPVIWSLNMERRTRIYLVAILSVGWIAVVAGIVKVVYQVQLLVNYDHTWNASFQVWNYIQLNLGIAAACAPMLRPFVGRGLGIEKNPTAKSYLTQNSQRVRFRGGRNIHTQISEFEYDLEQRTSYFPDAEADRERNMTFYREDSNPEPGGEPGPEHMLHGTRTQKQGIIKITEFSVRCG